MLGSSPGSNPDVFQQAPREELYDLEKDPYEQNNLANNPEQTERLAAMRADLEHWMNDQGDKLAVFGKPTLLDAAADGPE